jgi:hypothetical protein
MSCGFWLIPALAHDRKWAKSTIVASHCGTQQPCDLTQRRCRGQTFLAGTCTPNFERFSRRGNTI